MRVYKSVRKNPIILFTGSRYISFGLLFLRGIIIAKILGPYFFGIWGFLTLSLQYLNYTSLGVEYATTVELATGNKIESRQSNRINSTAISLTLFISIILLLFAVTLNFYQISFLEKYSFNQFVVLVVIIAGITNLQQVLTNIYRVYKKLTKIAIIELFTAVVLLITALMFTGELLVYALLAAMIVAGLISLGILLNNPPFPISLMIDKQIASSLLIIGIPLLIYNVSYFLIMNSARTILSIFYSVETMGFYSLANAVTTATLLGLRTIVWVVFPDILSRTHVGIHDDLAFKTVDKVNILYSTSVFFVVFVIILLLPFLFIILPQYKPAIDTIVILLLSQAVLSASFGYNSIAIARRNQNKVAKISILTVIVVTTLSLLVSYFQLNFVWIAGCVFIGSVFYTLLQIRLGSIILNLKDVGIKHFESVVSLGSIFAVVCFLIGIIFNQLTIFSVIGLCIFIGFNIDKLKFIGTYAINKIR